MNYARSLPEVFTDLIRQLTTLMRTEAQLARTEMSEKVIDDAMKHTANQIIELVGHMAEKLKEYGTAKKGERKFFMDSLVDNVRELVELLPAFNLTNNPKLDQIAKRMAKELCAEDAQALRENEAARKAVAKSADEIVAEVGKFFA